MTFRAAGKKPGRRVFMLKQTAEHFGFKVAPYTKKNSKGYNIPVKGSKGSGSVKVPSGEIGTTKYNKKTIKYAKLKRIPVPSDATIIEIQAFLKKATKNKPETFYSVDGTSHPVNLT
ncbi:MAG: hypothetical protein AAF915_23975 [Cyanobacteria bacterium P01_D01_bin.50]